MQKILPNGFGLRLKEERKRLNLSQKDFAEAAGVKRATQYLYESEDSAPNYHYFKACAENGVNISYLFFGERTSDKNLNLAPEQLRDIFRLVDEIGRDRKGNPLPLESRQDLFTLLCASYSGRESQVVNIEFARNVAGR